MKKELSMEARLLIAFALMGVVLLVSQFFLKPVPAPVATKETAAKNAKPVPAEAVEKPQTGIPSANAVRAAAGKAPAPNAVTGEKEELVTVETTVFKVVFSNRGAVVRNWILKGYRDHTGKAVDLVYQEGLKRVSPPFALTFKGQAPASDANTALFKPTVSADGLEASFEFSDGSMSVKKTFHFEKGSYLVGIHSEVTQGGALLPHLLTWRGGFGDATVFSPSAVQHALYYDTANSKLQVKQAKDAKDGPLRTSGSYSFAGLEDSYFAAAFLAGEKPSLDQTTYGDNVPIADGKEELRVGMGVGGEGVNTLMAFVGPKDIDLLRKVNPKLEQLVDWGWFGLLAKPLFLVLNWTSDQLTHNYGWAIVLVTLAINIVLFPLRITSMKSSKKMAALQPQIKAINDKYKNVGMKDPRKNEQNEEVMGLYKKHGVNPVGGCLPLLVQMPFLMAFYKVLGVSIELRGAHWLWVDDLSAPESIAIRLLPLLMMGTQFLTQKMTPNPGMDPSQAKMMMFMPLMMGFMFYSASSGLVLCWLTGNVVGIVQQWLLNRGTGKVEVISPPKATSMKKGRN